MTVKQLRDHHMIYFLDFFVVKTVLSLWSCHSVDFLDLFVVKAVLSLWSCSSDIFCSGIMIIYLLPTAVSLNCVIIELC